MFRVSPDCFCATLRSRELDMTGQRNPRQAIGIDHASRNRRGLYLHSGLEAPSPFMFPSSHDIRMSFASSVAACFFTALQLYRRLNLL